MLATSLLSPYSCVGQVEEPSPLQNTTNKNAWRPFLVLVGNSLILRSYTLLLFRPFLCALVTNQCSKLNREDLSHQQVQWKRLKKLLSCSFVIQLAMTSGILRLLCYQWWFQSCQVTRAGDTCSGAAMSQLNFHAKQ